MGDALCESTIDEGAETYTPQELYGFAIDRLTEALSQATDADLRNWINVGLARASLDRLEYTQAMQYRPGGDRRELRRSGSSTWTTPGPTTRCTARSTVPTTPSACNPRWLNGGMGLLAQDGARQSADRPAHPARVDLAHRPRRHHAALQDLPVVVVQRLHRQDHRRRRRPGQRHRRAAVPARDRPSSSLRASKPGTSTTRRACGPGGVSEAEVLSVRERAPGLREPGCR